MPCFELYIGTLFTYTTVVPFLIIIELVSHGQVNSTLYIYDQRILVNNYSSSPYSLLVAQPIRTHY